MIINVIIRHVVIWKNIKTILILQCVFILSAYIQNENN